MKTYTTVQGDMWDSIAYRQMGGVDYTDQLMNANQQYREYYTFNDLYHELAERISLEHLDLICEALQCDLSDLLVRDLSKRPSLRTKRPKNQKP